MARTAPNEMQAAAMTADAGKSSRELSTLQSHSCDRGSGGSVHDIVKSGSIIWCRRCGCYADARVLSGILGACKGPPPRDQYGGRGGQLKRLRAGIHPRTFQPLPPTTKIDGSPLEGSKRYDRRDQVNEARSPAEVGATATGGDSLFVAYVPKVFEQAKPVQGKTAKEKMAERLARVRSTPAAVPGVRRRLRTKQCIAYPIRN